MFVQPSCSKGSPPGSERFILCRVTEEACLKRRDAGYPGSLEIALGEDAPDSLWSRGPLSILEGPVVAVFCSRACTGLAATRTHDVLQALREAGVVLAGGFQSPLEQTCCELYRKSPLPIIVGIARHLPGSRISTLFDPFAESGRLLVVSQENETTTRVTRQSAFQRNVLLAALADRVFVPHSAAGSQTARFVDFIACFGKEIYSLQAGNLAKLIPGSGYVNTSDSSLFDGK